MKWLGNKVERNIPVVIIVVDDVVMLVDVMWVVEW